MARNADRDTVARLAEVSPITVSRVFTNSHLVSEHTRRRVLEASKVCNYTPNAAARAIRTQRFNRVAFVVTTFQPRGRGSMPNVLSYLTAATDVLAQRGFSVIYEHFHLEEGTRKLIEPPRLFMELAADGVIGMSGGYVPQEVDTTLASLGAPVIWVNRNADEGVPAVISDECEAGRQMVRHLIELGHRRIGYISYAQLLHYSAVQRLQGIQSELEAAGLPTDAVIRCTDRFSRLQAIEQLLTPKPRITALICYNGLMYWSAMQVAAQQGIRVPADLSMSLFASEWELDLNLFPVTAVLVPEGAMALAAVEALLPMIERRRSGDAAGAKPVIPPVRAELRIGRTTGPART